MASKGPVAATASATVRSSSKGSTGSGAAEAKPKTLLEFLAAYWWVGAAAAGVIILIYGICHFCGNDPSTKAPRASSDINQSPGQQPLASETQAPLGGKSAGDLSNTVPGADPAGADAGAPLPVQRPTGAVQRPTGAVQPPTAAVQPVGVVQPPTGVVQPPTGAVQPPTTDSGSAVEAGDAAGATAAPPGVSSPGALSKPLFVDIGGKCNLDKLRCKEGSCKDNKCQWVGVGEECTKESECEHGLCQADPDNKKWTCRAKLGDKCEIAADHCLEEHACEDGKPHAVCKAVIGGSCKTQTDCYQSIFALTHALRPAGYKEPNKTEDKPLMQWCDKKKRCQVRAGLRKIPLHAPITPTGSRTHQCWLGDKTFRVEEVEGESVCKAYEGQECHDPRGRPMPSWCFSGICEESAETQGNTTLEAKKRRYKCKKETAAAQIQLGERADAWSFTNASLAETAAHAGKTSNNLRGNRGKRTRSPDASALRVDPR